jgi:hypothetical protein
MRRRGGEHRRAYSCTKNGLSASSTLGEHLTKVLLPTHHHVQPSPQHFECLPFYPLCAEMHSPPQNAVGIRLYFAYAD